MNPAVIKVTPAKKAPIPVRINEMHNLRSGTVLFINQAMRTVVRIEHRLNVKKLNGCLIRSKNYIQGNVD